MIDTIESKILDLVEKRQGWKREDLVLEEDTTIRLPAGRFFAVSHQRMLLSSPWCHAVLPGDRIVPESEPGAAATILRACGGTDPAKAGSWAEVVACYDPGLGPGVVLHSPGLARLELEALAPQGISFRPPELLREGDGTTVHFYFLDPLSGHLSEVHASLRQDGPLALEVRRLWPRD